ncbi:BTB/POZ protein [Apiospora rasikravindrae]|uniref:BTB/POZ protein n=1 Tax=Apiospora rasikravindrae TaxID=990691 RepID=A0ABR1SDD0_9PEZI
MAAISPNARSDEKLLLTGNFSDVLVRCGDEDWRLHKLMLSSRCLYFRTGLSNAWVKCHYLSNKTCTSNLLKLTKVLPKMLGNPAFFYIDEQDVQAVWWIVIWIYTGCLPGEILAEDGSNITACLRLIHCSRVFLLPDLTAYAQNHLYHTLQKTMIEAQTAFCMADNSKVQFDVSDLYGFFAGVEKVYEKEGDDNEFAGEKQYFTNVVKGAHFWPLLDSNFQMMTRHCPQFWAEVMSLQETAITDGAHWPYLKPDECHKCEHSPWQFDDLPRSTHWATLKLVKGKCQATCNRCAGDEERKLWYKLRQEEERKFPSESEDNEGGPNTSSNSDTGEQHPPSAISEAKCVGITGARKDSYQTQESDSKWLEWLSKVSEAAIPTETRKAHWKKKIDEMRQAAQGRGRTVG